MSAKKITLIHKLFPFLLQTVPWVPTRLIFNFFWRFEAKGKENLKNIQQAIFAVNHTSELDPILLTAAFSPLGRFMPMFYLAAPIKEFKDSKFSWRRHIYKSAFFMAWGAHETIRGLRNYETSLSTHVQLLKRGNSLCVFPEGKLSKTGEPGEPHGGIIHLARASGVPIVPVAITGAYRMTPRLFFGRKRHIVVEFGKPVLAHQISSTNVEEYHDEAINIFSSVSSMLKKRETSN